jgi:TetR/AcrR family transcriptional regulator
MPASQTLSKPHPASAIRHERRKDARPGELLAAALDLFVEKGFAATRVEEVAARAGVSKGTLFLYFASKDELFKAVVRENISGRFPQWNVAIEAFDGGTADMLRYAMTLWWERLGNTKASGITKLMLSEAKNFPELAAFYQQEVMQPAHELVRRILQRGVDRGEFAPMNMQYTVYAVLSPMLFLQMMMHASPACCDGTQAAQLVPEDFLAAQVQTLLDGLRLRPPPPASDKGLISL